MAPKNSRKPWTPRSKAKQDNLLSTQMDTMGVAADSMMDYLESGQERSNMLTTVIEILKQVLDITIDTNLTFFEMGMQMHQARAIVNIIQTRLLLSVTPLTLLQCNSVGVLVKQLLSGVFKSPGLHLPSHFFFQQDEWRRPFEEVPPMWFFPTDTGTVLSYIHVVRAMTLKGRSMVGLNSPVLTGRLTHLSTAAERAAYYSEVIRGLQPKGPYILVGFGCGGVAALTTASVLQDAGQTVEKLVMVDSSVAFNQGVYLSYEMAATLRLHLPLSRKLTVQNWQTAIQPICKSVQKGYDWRSEEHRSVWHARTKLFSSNNNMQMLVYSAAMHLELGEPITVDMKGSKSGGNTLFGAFVEQAKRKYSTVPREFWERTLSESTTQHSLYYQHNHEKPYSGSVLFIQVDRRPNGSDFSVDKYEACQKGDPSLPIFNGDVKVADLKTSTWGFSKFPTPLDQLTSPQKVMLGEHLIAMHDPNFIQSLAALLSGDLLGGAEAPLLPTPLPTPQPTPLPSPKPRPIPISKVPSPQPTPDATPRFDSGDNFGGGDF